MYSAFNFLLVSYGFGNPSLLVAGPAVIAKVATVSLGLIQRSSALD